jgi:hypothetical protein
MRPDVFAPAHACPPSRRRFQAKLNFIQNQVENLFLVSLLNILGDILSCSDVGNWKTTLHDLIY